MKFEVMKKKIKEIVVVETRGNASDCGVCFYHNNCLFYECPLEIGEHFEFK